MTKDSIVHARIDNELKAKAKDQNINISEAIENALKEKTRDIDRIALIVKVENYGVSIAPYNWVVGRLLNDVISQDKPVGKEFFEPSTLTYHSSLKNALIALSDRIIEDKVRMRSKEKVLEIKELVKLIKEHHAWFVKLVEEI